MQKMCNFFQIWHQFNGALITLDVTVFLSFRNIFILVVLSIFFQHHVCDNTDNDTSESFKLWTNFLMIYRQVSRAWMQNDG